MVIMVMRRNLARPRTSAAALSCFFYFTKVGAVGAIVVCYGWGEGVAANFGGVGTWCHC